MTKESECQEKSRTENSVAGANWEARSAKHEKTIELSDFFALSYNGSTTDFGSVYLGSNPSGAVLEIYMKTCRMMFYSDYVSDEQLVKAVQNSSHLDKCYIGVYEKNWNGTDHEELNEDLLNSLGGNTEIVHLSDEKMNISGKETPNIIETHCRNYILEKSKSENFDLMVVQDTDEFLSKEDYDFMMNDYFPTMFAQGYDSCAIRLKNFWKSWKYLLVCEEELVPEWPGEWANFGIRIQPETKFLEIRQHTSIQKCGVKQPCYLYHGTFVHTDKNVKKKIRSWGHSNDIDFDVWYRDKWLNWTLETTDLHPSIRPSIWKRAVEYTGNLPEQL